MRFTRQKEISLISPADAAHQAADGTLVLVDVREPDERLEARPVGSVHIPLAEVQSRLGELPGDRTIAFICRSGRRSALAARTAGDHGLSAADVGGGVLAWQSAGLPTESGAE